MSTPYERAKPPEPEAVEIHGCHVCGADPTHFSSTVPRAVALCANCEEVSVPTALAYGAFIMLAVPMPSVFPIFGAILLGTGWLCWNSMT